MRLIDADAWDSFYADMVDSRNMMDSYAVGYTVALDQVGDWMDAQPAIEAPQWIPVTERLPTCGERVLITDGYAVFEAYLSISHKWARGLCDWMDAAVTHWMPLPEPPKDGGAD